MMAKPSIALASFALALSACQDNPDPAPEAATTPEPIATVTQTATAMPTPTPTRSTALSVTPEATPCGAEKLQNYLNLLPTSTAKDEISLTLGHNRVRYVALEEARTTKSPDSPRVTAGIGVDGRIKEFACG